MIKRIVVIATLVALCKIAVAQPWTKGAFETGQYRNLFVEMGYEPTAVEAKLKEVFNDVFHGPDKVYFEVGDSMGYVSDIKNHDVRTEGMSYGMMIAVQMGEKDIFDRLWRWCKRYMQHQDGPHKGYFAWSLKTDGTRNSEGAASDGELYFITALVFASNRWGNDSGINYKAEARNILDCIQPRELPQNPNAPAFGGFGQQQRGPQKAFLIDPETKLITFTPEGFGQRYTDPSYHIPAFYEVWAKWADDGRAEHWMECARKSREFLHKAIHPETGLNPDMCGYDGSLMQGFGGRRNGGNNFRYDSWRVPMNITLDYEWSCADGEWQRQYGERIQNFFYAQGVDKFVDQYRVDGTLPEDNEILGAGGFRKLRHSIGLVASTAAASLLCSHEKSREFVDALWNAKHEPFEDGYFDAYYDGLLRLFAFMHLSGHYRVITPTVGTSPDGRLSVRQLGNNGLTLCYDGKSVIDIPCLGHKGYSKMNLTFVRQLKEDYRMVSGKRIHCVNEANEYRTDGGITVRIYNDGLAFRSEPNSQSTAEPEYLIPEGTRRWMQQWTDSYEGFFPLSTTYKVKPAPSYSGISKSADGWNDRWGYPALLEPSEGLYCLITEANIGKGQSASCLFNDGECFKVVKDKENAPSTDKPSPWRLVIAGPLNKIVESTLVTDVSEPNKLKDTKWIKPGVVSWVYWAYNHGSNDYNIIKKYVDLAESLHLPYVLIDAEWDQMKDGKTIEDAIAYAKSKKVRPLIWYNSSVGWVDGAPTPKFRLNKPEDREREFAWCEKLGVAGVKIDFFSGDNQQNMDYCIDLLESAARHHLLVNFHGATIPRGWQRTYPNLLSTEGVYGAEWYNNVATFTDKAAAHNATLPFTRNVIGPMDYTPCAFSDSQHPHITSHAHELALTVLFESGLQHLADRPESFLAQPQEVKSFLGNLPAVWDETRLVGGSPAEYAVIARRSGKTWYIAGINGTDNNKTIELDLAFIQRARTISLFADSGTADSPWRISKINALPKSIDCLPRGGFILVATY